MKKKKNYYLNFAVAFAVIAAVLSVVYAYRNLTAKTDETDAFRVAGLSTKNNDEATGIYNRIMSYDLDKIYPQTAEDVMRLYNDTVYMLYGDMIIDPELTEQVLGQQRKLCSDELIGNLGFDEQLINLQVSTGILKEQGIQCLGISERMVKYDPSDKNICTISITSTFTKGLTVYRNYTLYYNDTRSRWEVYSWEQTNENFGTIIN